MFDILIQNGFVADGSGKPGYLADVAVQDGKIVKIAPAITEPAKETINATGLVVAPGFIDCHNHSDSHIFMGTDAYNYLEQGVTTQICGHCGDSPAPYFEGNLLRLKQSVPEGEFAVYARQSATPTSFFETMEKASLGANMAFFIGHNSLRAKVMGFSPEAPTKEQLEAMQAYIREAMEVGYLGYSSGLAYAPSVYANTEELIELAKAMVPYGGIYSSHIRSEGDDGIAALEEAIRVGEEAGVQVQVSHLKVVGRHNEGMSDKLLQLIDDANARGVRVYADQYPYTAGSAPLRAQIPPKYHVGGVKALLEKLKDSNMRQEILQDMMYNKDGFESLVYAAGFEGSLIAVASATKEHVGKTLTELAQEQGKTPMDAMCDLLLVNDGIVQGIYFNQNPSDMLKILAHPKVFGGSDSSNYPDERFDPNTRGGRHVRGSATMVRRLELQRDFRLCSLEEAVHRITGVPAEAMHLENQGLLKEGYDANITIFDYENLHARGSYSQPYRENEGICHVLVNGTVAVKDGHCTGSRAGKLLRRGR